MPRILVVDDHVANCLPLTKLFKYSGMEARYLLRGQEALDQLFATAPDELPDVVLLDVMMPEMDGFEVLRQLRGNRRYDRMAVLMYTAVVDLQSQIRAVERGAQGYLVKGTPFDELRAQVMRHVGRSSN